MFRISGCMWHPHPVLLQATNTEIKSYFKSNEKEWRATKTNKLTQYTTCGNTPVHNKQSHQATWGVMGAIHPQIHAVWAAALTLDRLFLLAPRPGEGIAEEWGNILDMCDNFPHWASCWGSGRGRRCKKGSRLEAKSRKTHLYRVIRCPLKSTW